MPTVNLIMKISCGFEEVKATNNLGCAWKIKFNVAFTSLGFSKSPVRPVIGSRKVFFKDQPSLRPLCLARAVTW